jgi:hypothetical protein
VVFDAPLLLRPALAAVLDAMGVVLVPALFAAVVAAAVPAILLAAASPAVMTIGWNAI